MADAQGSRSPNKPSLEERAQERVDVRMELDQLEDELTTLKILYEQYFAGVFAIAPEKQEQLFKAHMRRLKKAPFKSSAMNFKLRAIDSRYQTYNNYWQRVLREREEGTYSKDVFKANLREAFAEEDSRAVTKIGKTEKHMRELFNAYRSALEKTKGTVQELDFGKFRESLTKTARDLKEKMGSKKIAFSIVIKEGKVKVKAKCS